MITHINFNDKASINKFEEDSLRKNTIEGDELVSLVKLKLYADKNGKQMNNLLCDWGIRQNSSVTECQHKFKDNTYISIINQTYINKLIFNNFKETISTLLSNKEFNTCLHSRFMKHIAENIYHHTQYPCLTFKCLFDIGDGRYTFIAMKVERKAKRRCIWSKYHHVESYITTFIN